MAFFEKLGKRLTDAGQSVAQQTKDITEVTKLNSAISKNEKQVSQLFSLLGQSYYKKHWNDSSAEEIETISQINALYKEISENRKKIRQIKGIVKCENCGAELSAGTAFCNACGAKVIQPEPETSKTAERVCPNCQATAEEGHLFCKYCGAKID